MKIFWSYARRDDLPPARKVTRLKEAFSTVLSQVRGEDCEIHFDMVSLKWGVEWRSEIDRLIRQGDALIAVVTPSYFNSRMCIYELQAAAEAKRQILPIYFRTCKTMGSTFKEDGLEAEINQRLNKASRRLGRLQMMDYRPLRNERPDTKQVEDFLDAMAEQLA